MSDEYSEQFIQQFIQWNWTWLSGRRGRLMEHKSLGCVGDCARPVWLVLRALLPLWWWPVNTVGTTEPHAYFYTTAEAANHLGVTEGRVRQLLGEGEFPSSQKWGTAWMLVREEVDSYKGR